MTPPPVEQVPWWREAVIYQVYVRSFADSDGDGQGDIPGIRSRLPYLRDLGVDAVWLTPFYVSPLKDGGYDVADYRDIDPVFGTVADVEQLVADAHELGLRVLIDIVPNHTSSDHRWFQEALRTPPGEGAWRHYHCLPGRGEGGAEPPTDWRSAFGGRAWSPVLDAAGDPTGWWYLHLFDASQPDLNWSDPAVHADFEQTLRFWFDRGVDGFRIDVAHGLVKADGYPMSGESQVDTEMSVLGQIDEAPQWDQPGVHDVFREWRAVADSYDPPRAFVGEVWVSTPERLAAYLRPDELHTAFNFDYLKTPWYSDGLRRIIDHTVHACDLVGAPTTWVLSNHDVWRHRTRLAPWTEDGRPDDVVGLDRARAATVFMLALPGSAYVYQGEELGLAEIVDLPDEARQDPVFFRTGGLAKGRDGCRIPLPWSGTSPSYGFGPGPLSWLPQPPEWADLSVQRQTGDPGSTLELYRAALALRRAEPALGDGEFEWRALDPAVPGGKHLVAVLRPGREPGGPAVLAVLNMGKAAVHLPASWGTDVLLASGPGVAVLADGGADADRDGAAADPAAPVVVIAPNTAAWLRG